MGTCGGGLPPELYADALAGLVSHLAAPDLVAALAAAQAVAALATRLMIEDSVRAAPCRMPAGALLNITRVERCFKKNNLAGEPFIPWKVLRRSPVCRGAPRSFTEATAGPSPLCHTLMAL